MVKFYHKKGCGLCMGVEKALKQNNITYEDILATDAELIEMGIKNVPTLRVEDKDLIGRDILLYIKDHKEN